MENNCRLHKKRTAVGYFLLGVMSFFVGIFYGLYDDGILVPSLEDTLQIFMGNLQAILYAVASSMIFYYVFFSIRKKIDDIKTERDEEGMVKHILTEKELLDLRVYTIICVCNMLLCYSVFYVKDREFHALEL